MSEATAICELATRFFDAIETGNVQDVEACFSHDAVVWHNFDDLEQHWTKIVPTLAGMIERISDRRYSNRRLVPFSGGFVQQHLLSGVRKDGVRVSLTAALIAEVKDNRITRIDEYIDSAQIPAFLVQV
ncbi:nuclear transport factor 2 family protein [Paraburkholderia sp. Ac-20340]|uniref:nuclear transport factor 2 family protein n=1 Tax=Paraburkholderia sp. Ac-20340 TaxID=2703888 RepID=UPI00198263AD|nr:nuclear transport factor 2 family protein [Paraburkholderia sp. Ac-20340]MBN3854748.1 nuclear transport factor 2 family protein [Paraburkholderia sp. Ac-20340]